MTFDEDTGYERRRQQQVDNDCWRKPSVITNPLQSKLAPWHIAVARRTFIAWATLPIIYSETFFRTWTEVMYPGE